MTVHVRAPKTDAVRLEEIVEARRDADRVRDVVLILRTYLECFVERAGAISQIHTDRAFALLSERNTTGHDKGHQNKT